MAFQLSCTAATLMVSGEGGKSEIYSSVATLKFNITFQWKTINLND